MSNTLIVAAFIVLGASACTPNTSVSPGDYDQSCTADSDCTIIYADGDLCTCPGPAAINEADRGKFEADRDQAVDRCTAIAACAELPYVPVPVCNAGTCAVEEAPANVQLQDAGNNSASSDAGNDGSDAGSDAGTDSGSATSEDAGGD